jgi:hypothetical protein
MINFLKSLAKILLIVLLVLSGTCFLIIKGSAAAVHFSRQPDVQIFSSVGFEKEAGFLAYDFNFRGGVNVTTGDVNGDNVDEIITGAGAGGGPHVRVFDKYGREKFNFFAFHSDFRGGIDVSSGDVDGDEIDEVVISQKSKGQAWIKVYNLGERGGRSNFSDPVEVVLAEFLAYDENFKGGAHITVGDIDGDEKEEIVTGAGAGGGPHVRVFDGNGNSMGINLFPFPLDYHGGVDVASSDVDGDKVEEIIVSANRYAASRVKIYESSGSIIGNFVAYDEAFQGGANIASEDINNDEKYEILTVPNSGGGPNLRAFRYTGEVVLDSFMAYPVDFRGGISVSAGNVDIDPNIEIIVTPLRKISEEKRIVGFSVQGRPIEAYFFGEGYKKILFIGGTHGGTERNTVALMNKWVNYLGSHPEVIPSDCQVIVVPNHNPDGYANFSRYNAHGVDLNRNFSTSDWNPIAYLWNRIVNSGSYPFSEPENVALKNFIYSENINRLVSYHSAANKIFASEIADGVLFRPSLNFARFYNSYSGYNLDDNFLWEYYPISGDLSSWVSQAFGIPAITVELSDGISIDWERNLPAMIASINY